MDESDARSITFGKDNILPFEKARVAVYLLLSMFVQAIDASRAGTKAKVLERMFIPLVMSFMLHEAFNGFVAHAFNAVVCLW